MVTGPQARYRFLFGLAIMFLLAGLLAAAWLIKQSRIGMYPSMIADAYQETRHHLTVPGKREITLDRKGVYGIYYEHSLIRSIYPDVETPPEIDCTLISKSTGVMMNAVPDYVKTNRYRSRDLKTGVLIMSVTIEIPDTYFFECNYQDGRMEPEIVVALGPNYLWEFLRVAWKIGYPLCAGTSILCASLLLALSMLVTGLIIKAIKMSPPQPQD